MKEWTLKYRKQQLQGVWVEFDPWSTVLGHHSLMVEPQRWLFLSSTPSLQSFKECPKVGEREHLCCVFLLVSLTPSTLSGLSVMREFALVRLTGWEWGHLGNMRLFQFKCAHATYIHTYIHMYISLVFIEQNSSIPIMSIFTSEFVFSMQSEERRDTFPNVCLF